MNKEFWNSVWKTQNLDYPPNYIPPAFNCWKEFLPQDKNLSCLEVGCVPGRLLIFLNKIYGYHIIGVDYAESTHNVEKNFEMNNIHDYHLYNQDFRDLSTEIKADIVISVGFIEHFTDYKNIIVKHTKHLKENGLLIITIPNFRFFQYYLHRIFDKMILQNHVLEIMNPKLIRSILLDCDLKIQECRYYGTFDYWCDTIPNTKIKRLLRMILLKITWKLKRLLTILNLEDMPNRFLSPHIVCIARK